MIQKSILFAVTAFLFMFGGILNFMAQDFFMGSMLLFASSLTFILVNKHEHLETYHPEILKLLRGKK